MSSAWTKVNSIHEAGQKNNTNLHLEETNKLVSLAQNLHNISNTDLKNKLSQYSSKFNVWDPNEKLQKQILEQTQKDLKNIEDIINEYISYIRTIRKEIYSSYTYCMANYTLYAEDDFKKHIDDALEMYDSIEDQLIWFKKKIGLSSSSNDNNNNDSSGNENESGNDNENESGNDNENESGNDNENESGNGNENNAIKPKDITLVKYEKEFNVMNSNYKYVVKYETEDGELVDEITLPIKSQNLKTISLKLVSIATNGNNSYKTRANIEINIDGVIEYKINSYERIN